MHQWSFERTDDKGVGIVAVWKLILGKRPCNPAIDAGKAELCLVYADNRERTLGQVAAVALRLLHAIVKVTLQVVERGGIEGFHTIEFQSFPILVDDTPPADVGVVAVLLGTDIGIELLGDGLYVMADGLVAVPVTVVLYGTTAIVFNAVIRLGHDQLHRELAAGGAMQEFVLYDMASRSEYEANVFAADLLLDEEQMLDYMIHYRYDAEQIAQVMDTDINLVALRAAGLSYRGYKLNKLESRTDFLK